MMKKIVWIILTCLMVISLVLASCAEVVEEEEEEEEPPPTEEEEEEEEEGLPPIGGDWWDKLGEPEYGGTITRQVSSHTPNFDVCVPGPGALWLWHETLVSTDWTVDRETYPFNSMFTPLEYHAGVLAESWEMPDAQTMIFHIREGVHWQDKPPVNGREFTAYDVPQHYTRWLETSPLAGWLSMVESVTATDKYTVVVKFKAPSAIAIYQFFAQGQQSYIEAPEAVEQGVIGDWRYAVGTGAWILTDYVAGSSLICIKNPNYWGYDERHPQNRLPYADKLKVLVIPDIATSVAALRTGKIDLITGLGWEKAVSLTRTNPELKQVPFPAAGGAVDFRVDKEPFTDINVRKALQMSIDRETIAKTHYGGTVEGIPAGIMSPIYEDYCFNYEEWPQELKDEYSYNPERAKQLLEEAGYPNGFETNCIANATWDLELLQIIKAYFLDIGVDMEIKVLESTSFSNFGRARQMDQMTFGNHWSGRPVSADNIIRARYSTDVSMNYACVNDPAYDALVDSFFAAASEEEGQRVMTEADRYALEKHWALYVFPIVTYYAYQPYIKGFSGEELGWIQWRYWTRYWIDQDLKKTMGY